MSGKNTGGAAFPVVSATGVAIATGMSLRDYFAAAALGGILSCVVDHTGFASVPLRAKKAYEYADAMLTERSKP